MRAQRVYLLLVAVVGSALPSHAQSDMQANAERSLAVAPSNLPFAGTSGAKSGEEQRTAAQVILEGSTKDKTGTLSLSRKTGSLHYELKVTGALDEATSEAVPLTLDGLSAGSRASFNFSQWIWHGPSLREHREFLELCRHDAATCSCELEDFEKPADQAAAKALLATTRPSATDLLEAQKICATWTGSLGCSTADIQDPAERGRAQELLKGTPPTASARAQYQTLCRERAKACRCQLSDFTDPAVHAEALHLERADRRPIFIGGGVEVGRTRFKYVDPTSLGAKSAIHNDWSVSGRAGAFIAPVGFFVATYSYAKAFSPAGAPTNVCTPLDNTTVTGSASCRSVTIGPPTSSAKSVVSLQLRRISTRGVGFAPTVQRDVRAKVTAVVLPVYFFVGTDKDLVGGVRAGWRSDQKGATVSVFVGTAFSLAP